MSKALFTYTTEVTVTKSVAAIEAMLVKAGASTILKEYSSQPAGEVAAISFRIATEFGTLTLRLPARIDAVLLRLRQQVGSVPRHMVHRDQAGRVAWRVVYHWLEAQLAMIEVGNAQFAQVMLPYVQQTGDGKPLYELLEERKFVLGGIQLALPAPEKGAA